MKLQKSIAVCVGTVIGCQLSTGCATTSPQNPETALTPPPTTPVATAPAPKSTPTVSMNRTADPVSFDSPQISSPNGTSGNTKSEPSRNTRLIGLYGELGDTTSNAGTPYDGGSNLGQITFATEGACVDPDVDRTGTWLAFASTMHRNTADIYIKSVTGKTQTQVTNDPADDVMPAFSPDGKTIAFASNRAGNWDIYSVGIEGGKTVQITNDPDHELHPSWSPDGRTIAYCKFGAQSQRWEIWTVDVANPGVRNFLEYGVFPHWCPDPAKPKILFQRAKQRGSRDYSIWTIDVVNGQAKYPTEIVSAANAALINPSWSPDGSRIVFVTVVDPDSSPESRPNQSDLWIVNLDGSERTSLTNGHFANFQPVWAANSVYFVSDRSGSDNVWAVNAMRTPMKAVQTAGVTSSDAESSITDSHP